jgi:DegV family protein with EDD domain
MPPDWPERFAIQVIPVNIHFGEMRYLQGVDLSDQEFYELAQTGDVIPTTSQPTPHQFVEFYRRFGTPGDTILSIHVTAKLSGTFNSAQMAAAELADEFQVIPFDSGAGSAAMGFMCREARGLAEAGAPIEEILARMDFIRQHVRIYLTLDRLDFARRSGRVRALQAALASLLNIKPIIGLEDGSLEMVGRVRTRRGSIAQILKTVHEEFGDRPLNVAVVHAMDPETGKDLKNRTAEMLNCNELIMTDLSISVAANLGPGTVGVIAYPAAEDQSGKDSDPTRAVPASADF